ncbi:related to n-alkane-inducible cytochrome P450 [Cephalotrichum gorgonifer]|uniref:Related to n-alkane-inducible cytochrome P450 n=1 Tax=Cephalotrichum gorgonifer TaxID=2041049 RepID=A0AAE8MQU3_9PEZI|nr:related to n-alkane-inducible cytochrome P450 [Cephalotrichum gorgonifer]
MGVMGAIGQSAGEITGRSVAVFVATSCALYYILLQLDRRRRRNRLGASAPRAKYRLPFGIDFVLHGLRRNAQNLCEEGWMEHFAHTGTYTASANVFGREIVLTAEPENIKAMLSTQFPDYGKGESYEIDWKGFLGDSIFSTDGETWHASRQLIRPQFVKDRVSDLHCFENHVQNLFRMIENGGPLGGMEAAARARAGAEAGMGGVRGADGKTVNISDLFFRLALDASTDFLLGKSVDSWCHLSEPFADAFDAASEIQSNIIRASSLSWLIPRFAFRSHLRVVDSFINTYIERALRLSPSELSTKTKSDADYTFLHAIASFTRDRTVLRDQLLAVLLAGRDTTASTLSFALYELARRPDVVSRLRREILAAVGDEGKPTYGDLKNMPYLKAVVNETLRLYPAVPFNTRVALRDTTLPRGGGPDGRQPVAILKGTIMGYSTLIMQRRADIYPPVSGAFADPAAFSPERWESWHPRGHEYVPFNAGPRICVGQQFALTEMTYVLCRLFQRYERVEGRMGPAGAEKPSMKTDLTLKPGDPVRVAFFEAEK